MPYFPSLSTSPFALTYLMKTIKILHADWEVIEFPGLHFLNKRVFNLLGGKQSNKLGTSSQWLRYAS